MKHKFEDEFFEIVKDVVKHWKKSRKTSKLKAYLEYIDKITSQETEIFERELSKVEQSDDVEKMKEWVSEVLERLSKRSKFKKEIQRYRPSILDRLLGS